MAHDGLKALRRNEEVFSPKAVVEHLQLAKRFWPPEPAQNAARIEKAEVQRSARKRKGKGKNWKNPGLPTWTLVFSDGKTNQSIGLTSAHLASVWGGG